MSQAAEAIQRVKAQRRVHALKLSGLLQCDEDAAIARFKRMQLGRDATASVEQLRIARELLEELASCLEDDDAERWTRVAAARDALKPALTPAEPTPADTGEEHAQQAPLDRPSEPVRWPEVPRLDAPPPPVGFSARSPRPARSHASSPWAPAAVPALARPNPAGPRHDDESTSVMVRPAAAEQRVHPDGFTIESSEVPRGPALPFTNRAGGPGVDADQGTVVPDTEKQIHPDDDTAPDGGTPPDDALPFRNAQAEMRLNPDGETLAGAAPSEEPALPFGSDRSGGA